MKNTFRLIGIIALLAIIGFSMAACGDDGGGSAKVGLYRSTKENIVEISDLQGQAYNVTAFDFKVYIDGKLASYVGAFRVNNKDSITTYISTPLEVGKRYNVRVDYTPSAGKGTIKVLANKFPFVQTLTCKSR